MRPCSSPITPGDEPGYGNPAYLEAKNARLRALRRGDRAEARTLLRRMYQLPSRDPQDPHYRRLRYSRYADDHLLGFIGTKAEAEQIKDRLAAFLRDDLKLELSKAKTLITHARSQAARYLSYEITTQHCDTRGPVLDQVPDRAPGVWRTGRSNSGCPQT